MLAVQVTCPHCQAVLKTSQPLPAGQKVRCAKCGGSFLTHGDVGTPRRSPEGIARSAQAPPSPEVVPAPNNPPGSAQFPLRSTHPRAINRTALAAIIVGSCLFVGAGIAVA